LEDTEDLVDVTHVEAGAVVLDEVRHLVAVAASADLDPRELSLGRELDGVGQQVDEKLPDQLGVAVSWRQVTDDELDLVSTDLGSEVADGRLDQRVHVELLGVEGLAAKARELQEVVDELTHLAGALA